MPLHSVLVRQLKRLGLSSEVAPASLEAWQEFLSKLSTTFEDLDQERYLLERSLMISSKEMQERWKTLVDQQEKLVKAAKLASLGEMSSGIAHEINNPLAIIVSYMALLEKAIQKKELKIELAQKVVDNVQNTAMRISRIIKGLRTLSRDDGEFRPTQVSFKEVISDLLGLNMERMKGNGIDFRFDQKSPLLEQIISCDPIQLSQVLINLINNAVDAVEDAADKWVEIKLEKTQSDFIIKIIDSGPGIPPEILDKIFTPFFTNKPVGKGTGLGLSISKSIIEKHKGTLELDQGSTHTCFIVRIPLPH